MRVSGAQDVQSAAEAPDAPGAAGAQDVQSAAEALDAPGAAGAPDVPVPTRCELQPYCPELRLGAECAERQKIGIGSEAGDGAAADWADDADVPERFAS